jgi:flagellar motor switch protein FliG
MVRRNNGGLNDLICGGFKMGDISIEFTEFVETRSDDLLKKIFSKLDKSVVAKALKTIDPKTSEKIFMNLSENESEEIKNNMSGTVRIEEVEAAQRQIINIINKENIV